MRIKKVTNSNVLEPGQLLVVLHCLSQCGSDALFDRRLHQPPNPQQSLLGLVKFGGPCRSMPSGKYRKGTRVCHWLKTKWVPDGCLCSRLMEKSRNIKALFCI